MKVVERIFEHRIWQQIEVDDMQFGFMKGKGTTGAIFTVSQMQENFRVTGKNLYFGFVDLEKAFDRVPREVIRWAVCKLGVEEWLVSAVIFMYTTSPPQLFYGPFTGLCTQVQKQLSEQFFYGNSSGFGIKLTCTKVQH